MRLDNFEIANVGPHRSVSFTIAPGINLLTGRNGTGKSTLLHCLEASVTGDYGVFVGTKPENVNVLAGKRAPSYFRAHWHHAGHDLDILRHLGNTKPELRIDGGNAIVGADAVNATLAEILDIPLYVLSGFVFVKQAASFAATPGTYLV